MGVATSVWIHDYSWRCGGDSNVCVLTESDGVLGGRISGWVDFRNFWRLMQLPRTLLPAIVFIPALDDIRASFALVLIYTLFRQVLRSEHPSSSDFEIKLNVPGVSNARQYWQAPECFIHYSMYLSSTTPIMEFIQ